MRTCPQNIYLLRQDEIIYNWRLTECTLNFIDQRLHRDLGLGGGSLVIGGRLDFQLVSGGSPIPLAVENSGDDEQNQESDGTCKDHYFSDSGKRFEPLVISIAWV